MKKNLLKKLIAMMIIVVMTVSILPTAFAAEQREIVPGQTVVLNEKFEDIWDKDTGTFASGNAVSRLAADIGVVRENALKLFTHAGKTDNDNISHGADTNLPALSIPTTATRTTVSFEFMAPTAENAKYTLNGQTLNGKTFYFLRIEDNKLKLAKTAKDTDFNAEANYNAETIVPQKWYKLDIVMDSSEWRYDIYLDGRRVLKDGTNTSDSGGILKNLYWNIKMIEGRTAAEDTVYIDNVVVAYDTALLDENFHSWQWNSGIFSSGNAVSKLVNSGNSVYGNTLRLYSKGEAANTGALSGTIPEDAKYYTISFDFNLLEAGNGIYSLFAQCYNRSGNWQNDFYPWKIVDGVLMFGNNSVQNDYITDFHKSVTLNKGEWYSLDMVMNVEEGFYDIYLNDEHMLTAKNVSNPNGVFQHIFLQTQVGANATAGEDSLYIDNFAIYNYPNGKPGFNINNLSIVDESGAEVEDFNTLTENTKIYVAADIVNNSTDVKDCKFIFCEYDENLLVNINIAELSVPVGSTVNLTTAGEDTLDLELGKNTNRSVRVYVWRDFMSLMPIIK